MEKIKYLYDIYISLFISDTIISVVPEPLNFEFMWQTDMCSTIVAKINVKNKKIFFFLILISILKKYYQVKIYVWMFVKIK